MSGFLKDQKMEHPQRDNDAVWHHWLQPLQSVKERMPPPISLKVFNRLLEESRIGTKKIDNTLLLSSLRKVLHSSKASIETRFYNNNDGAVYVGMHSWVVDIILKVLFHQACWQFGLEDKVAVIAVGGYGRGEMAPFSDVDIMFLSSKTITPAQTKTIEFILYILWDLGLKVGHSTRTLKESVSAASDDQTILTSFLEMRPVTGDLGLWKRLNVAIHKHITKKKPLSFVEVKLDERDSRHRRYGDTRYVVEPNIKNGKGGLRDLHTLFWIAKYACRADSIVDVVQQGLLRESEARKFALAQRFLWTVRCHLHLYSGRPEERLDFEAQMEIAARMGFVERGGLRAVERFMKRYYLAARNVGNLTRIFCAVMETDFRKSLTSWRPSFFSKYDKKPFRINSGRIELDEEFLFRDDPVLLVELFALAHRYSADVHPNTLQRVTRALPSLGPKTRDDKRANHLFLEILTARENSERVLRLMNESGVLGKFLPDFGRIVAMMQFDMYHSYTVDEHTIKAIGVLHEIECGHLQDEAPLASEIISNLVSRRALYVAVLLHDIAKGRGGDHSIAGSKVAANLCPRLGLTSEETETVCWLVREHLLMSKTAFRYDLNDAQIIKNFSSVVQSPERLKLLLLLTVADIRAVGTNIWNGWKAALLRDLYFRCDSVLKEADPQVIAVGNANQAKKEARQQLSEWDDDRFTKHAANFQIDYWSSFDVESHVRHAKLFEKFSLLEIPLLIDFKPDSARRITELTIITVDDPGLFSRIAGAVAAAGVNIAAARIITCHDGTVLDVFFLQTDHNDEIDDTEELRKIEKLLRGALTGSIKLEKTLLERWEQTPLRVRQMPVPSRVMFSNKISSTHSVIEVNGRDFPGLLHRITHCLADLGVQIQLASVSTYGERVVDVFYVKDIFGVQIHNVARQKKIRTKLLSIFEDKGGAEA